MDTTSIAPARRAGPDRRSATDAGRSAIGDLIDAGDVTMVFQPLVDLASGDVVAVEALVRGPKGTPLESPAALFGAAARAGLTGELDDLCRRRALADAARSGRRADFTLFVNGEPGHLAARALQRNPEPVAPGFGAGPTVLELAERSVFDRPADLLTAVTCARARGWAIAVDDVGTVSDSLGLLPLVDPDVVKLDGSVVRDRPTRSTGLTLNAVSDHVERTGCTVVAEGIETEDHLRRACALGATIGQGWYFARPGPLETALEGLGCARLDLSGRRATAPAVEQPFDLVAGSDRVRRAPKELLYAISLDLEDQAASQPDGAVVLGAFQSGRNLTPATLDRYERLAGRCSLVAALGDAVAVAPGSGIRGVELAADDPLRHEWTVVVVSSHFTAALLALDVGDEGPDAARRFDYVVTYDRSTVLAAARSLLRRVLPRTHA